MNEKILKMLTEVERTCSGASDALESAARELKNRKAFEAAMNAVFWTSYIRQLEIMGAEIAEEMKSERA